MKMRNEKTTGAYDTGSHRSVPPPGPGSTVVVGMSGGVDSCATALILKEQGYRVIGVTLKVWEEEDQSDRKWQDRSCCKVGIARYVAKRLGIPHHVIDVRPEFKKLVVDDFVSGYLSGETPNPCIRCNERIKFGRLWEEAEALGADYLATGHYVRLVIHPETGRPILKKGKDSAKDQSYFLCRVRPELLPRLIFPLGDRYKSEIWEKIRELDLPPEEMQESQEICFVTEKDYRKFLKTTVRGSSEAGDFVTPSGEVLGSHQGIGFYTIGQRRGLGISGPDRRYVVDIRPADKTVVLGDEKDLLTGEVCANQGHFFIDWPAGSEKTVEVKLRYRSPTVTARVKRIGRDGMSIQFSSPQRAVAPGQSLVVYQDDMVLAGGILVRTPESDPQGKNKADLSKKPAETLSGFRV